MVFKRRDRRPWWRIVVDVVYPKGGWKRAFYYVQHRLHRLPGSPERIGRGIWAGVFTTFTPFYGLHFVIAALLAKIFRGNIFAALLATFFGNPLTYVPIGVASLKTGQWILGIRHHPAEEGPETTLGHRFVEAGGDLWNNFYALFTGQPADWHGLIGFYDQVFFPYMIGGILPGIVAASVCYYLSVPLIRAYQNRRQGAIQKGIGRLKKTPPRKGRPRGSGAD